METRSVYEEKALISMERADNADTVAGWEQHIREAMVWATLAVAAR